MYYLLKKLATDEAIPEFDAATLPCMQPANMTLQKYGDDLVAKLCKGADVIDKVAVNDASFDGVDSPICHSLKLHWAQNPQAGLPDIVLPAESLLSTQKFAGIMSAANQNTFNQEKSHNRKHWNNRSSANIVRSGI